MSKERVAQRGRKPKSKAQLKEDGLPSTKSKKLKGKSHPSLVNPSL